MNIIYVITLFIFGQNNAAEEIDQLLRNKITIHKLSALPKVSERDPNISRLGRSLFMTNLISGNRNISCMTCHHPRHGSSDALPFPIGEGGFGIGPMRAQGDGDAIRRNSPHLFNLGYEDIKFMFWDGRVSYNLSNQTFRTPEISFNGQTPKSKDITQVLSKSLNGALSAQTIFPLTSHEEMRGKPGTNEIADATSNLEVWEKVIHRLNKEQQYIEMFSKAFPGEEINIGHLGKAMGEFIAEEFNFVDTPFDRYLAGNINALSIKQKRGLKVFFNKGKCINCHKGRHLGATMFTSAAVPEIQVEGQGIDYGLFETTKRNRDKFKFLVRPLRNVALTAPFMHNGSLRTLKDVVIHYNKPKLTLDLYQIPQNYIQRYNQNITVDRDEKRNQRRLSVASEASIKFGLGLSKQEVEDLVDFLKYGLTDYRLQRMVK